MLATDLTTSDHRTGEEVTDGDDQHDHETDQGRYAGEKGDRADNRPAPRVQEQASQRFAPGQRGGLTGQLRISWIGPGELADLRLGLPIGDRREVALNELIGVRLRLRPGVDLLAGVLL